MAGRLDNKVALITGTGGGQGRTAALLFAKQGARVVGCDLKSEGARETVNLVEAIGGEMLSMQPVDLSDGNQVVMVANVHLINYTLAVSHFRAQLRQLAKILSKHQGPLIVSGDFNTWNDERMAVVDTIAGNLDLKAAWARLEQAYAVARQAGADLWPRVTGEASASRNRTVLSIGDPVGNVTNTRSQFSLGLAASYELDLWGHWKT